MNRFLRIWLVLALAFVVAKILIEFATDGALSRSAASWAAVPIATLLQTTVLTFLVRSTGPE